MQVALYKHTGHRFYDEADARDTIRVRIEPQTHEVSIDPAALRKTSDHMSPQAAAAVAMVELLRGQGLAAYDAVMAAGLTALAGHATTADEVGVVMNHAVEEAYRIAAEAEKERDEWQKLAEERGIEVRALERVINAGRLDIA